MNAKHPTMAEANPLQLTGADSAPMPRGKAQLMLGEVADYGQHSTSLATYPIAGWGSFVSMCTHKAAWVGRALLKVSPRFTSQICSGCGQVRKKNLSERWHVCECGTELDRDVNAAINILARGKALLVGKRPTPTTA
jgi:hypothetical protein